MWLHILRHLLTRKITLNPTRSNQYDTPRHTVPIHEIRRHTYCIFYCKALNVSSNNYYIIIYLYICIDRFPPVLTFHLGPRHERRNNKKFFAGCASVVRGIECEGFESVGVRENRFSDRMLSERTIAGEGNSVRSRCEKENKFNW